MIDYIQRSILLLTLAACFVGCALATGGNASTESPELASVKQETAADLFWARLKGFVGKTFEGQLVNAPANDDFAGKKMVMHILYGDDETILIPFNVGENRSRTWVFKKKSGRIELKHDHRMENGQPDEITHYGGTTTNEGTTTMQVFPADQETLTSIPAAFSNVWWVRLDSTSFTYNLRRMGTDRLFTVTFDVTKAIEAPDPSWGWEDFGQGKR